MFDLDSWQEIFETIRKNKLRTLLTAFSVAWGILILVVLLGSGEGLSNGVRYQFRNIATNSLRVWSGQTSKPFKGLRPGRTVHLLNQDYDDVKTNVKQADHLSARYFIRGNLTVAYKNVTSSYTVRCVHPDYQYIQNTALADGRFINPIDIDQCRKVVVLGDRARAQLFKDEPALGKYIKVNGIPFQVVGVAVDPGNQGEAETIYLPISTAQRAFNAANQINSLAMTLGDAGVDESNTVADGVRRRLAIRHGFDPDDQRAVFIFNTLVEFERYLGLTKGIRLFIWIIGVGTLLAGVVGVSNIMMITVKERTKEIGIRKAIGATPWSIMTLILMEAVLVTALAGYFGLVGGVGLLELMAHGITGSDYFRNPTVDLGVAVAATGLLVVAGAIAGFFPARRAAAIRPVEALRDE